MIVCNADNIAFTEFNAGVKEYLIIVYNSAVLSENPRLTVGAERYTVQIGASGGQADAERT